MAAKVDGNSLAARTKEVTMEDGTSFTVVKSKGARMYGVTDEKEPRVFSFKSNKFLITHPKSETDDTLCFNMRSKDGKNKKVPVAHFAEMCLAE